MIKKLKNVYFLILVIPWKVHFKAIKPASDRVSRWTSGENIWLCINIISIKQNIISGLIDIMESSKPWFSGHILAQIWFCPEVLKIGSKNFELSHRNGFHSLPSPTVDPSNAMTQFPEKQLTPTLWQTFVGPKCQLLNNTGILNKICYNSLKLNNANFAPAQCQLCSHPMPIVLQNWHCVHNWHCVDCKIGIVCKNGIVCTIGIVYVA